MAVGHEVGLTWTDPMVGEHTSTMTCTEETSKKCLISIWCVCISNAEHPIGWFEPKPQIQLACERGC